MIKHIKQGDEFLCIKDVYMIFDDDEQDDEPVYIEGKTYKCEFDGCITDETGDDGHSWTIDSEVDEYFVPANDSDEKEPKEEKAYVTDDTEMFVEDAIVPFDVAKELKQFLRLSIRNCKCVGTYDTNGKLFGDLTTEQFPAPTIYNAIAYMRGLYGIDVVIMPIDTSTAYMGGEKYYFKLYRGGRSLITNAKTSDVTYEKTAENGIREAINYIKTRMLGK